MLHKLLITLLIFTFLYPRIPNEVSDSNIMDKIEINVILNFIALSLINNIDIISLITCDKFIRFKNSIYPLLKPSSIFRKETNLLSNQLFYFRICLAICQNSFYYSTRYS